MLTGSDYLTSFSRRGKVAPLKKNEYCLTALGYLGHSEFNISEEVMAQVEKFFFIAKKDGYVKFSSIDAVRLEIFCKKYLPKKGNKLICQ